MLSPRCWSLTPLAHLVLARIHRSRATLLRIDEGGGELSTAEEVAVAAAAAACPPSLPLTYSLALSLTSQSSIEK